MMQGVLRYLDEDYGWVEYSVYAKDTFEDFKMYLKVDVDGGNITNYMNAVAVFDKHVDDFGRIYNPYGDDVSDTRRLDIRKVNKYKSNITNRLFCVRLSALVRYMQITGKQNYNQKLGALNDDMYFSNERVVDIEGVGRVVFTLGLIKELYCKNKFLELDLRYIDENLSEERIFAPLKKEDKYGNILSKTPIENVGFRLTSDVLGFEYKSEVLHTVQPVFMMYERLEDVLADHPDKNISWMLDRKYVIVTDDILEDVIKEFIDYDGYIAFDTETTGLNITFKSRIGQGDQLVGVVLSKQPGTGYYFPLQHKRFENLCGGDHWYFMEKYMKPILEKKKIVTHNGEFDWRVAYIYDIVTNIVYDTLLVFGVTKRYEEESFELGLKSLAKNLFGFDMLELSDFVSTGAFGTGINFSDLPRDIVEKYAPADGDMTLTLMEYAEREKILDKYNARFIFELEVEFMKAVAYSRFYGYRIDIDKVPEMKEKIIAKMKEHETNMFRMAGREFNPNSPQQLMSIMYDELGIEVIGNKRSTSKDVLKALSQYTDENGDPKYPFVIELKEYRDNHTIFKNFLNKLHEHATEDGYIFSEVKQLGTDTGRVSVGDPNYQSYNDVVKKYVVPRPGYFHFDCDFSQIEYRVLASLAKQENLIEAFADPDMDYHTYQASRMFNVEYALVSKDLRRQSKGINFGLPYGMGDRSLGKSIFGEENEENTRKAAILRRKYFQGQERIQEFFETTRSLGVSQGFTSTYFGRRRYYHRSKYSVSEIRRQAGNHVIQGTAADIYKLAVVRLFKRIIAEGWLGKVLFNAFVHDELLVEVHHSINPYYFLKVWREEFEVKIEGFCKIFAGCGIGKNWYDAKKNEFSYQFVTATIEKWHEDMEWRGDIDRFLKEIYDEFNQFEINRIKEYLLDSENRGKLVKPVITTLLVTYTDEAIKDIQKKGEIEKYNLLLGRDLIREDGHDVKKLRDNLIVFATYYGMDLSEVDVKFPDEVENNKGGDLGSDEDTVVEFRDDSVSVLDLLEMRGIYRDLEKNLVYLVDKEIEYNGFRTTVSHYLVGTNKVKKEGKYQLVLYMNGKLIPTGCFIDDDTYQVLLGLYTNVGVLSMVQRRWGF